MGRATSVAKATTRHTQVDGIVGDRPPPQWMVRLSSTRLSPARLGNEASTQGSGRPDWLQGTQMPWVPSWGQSSSGAKQEKARSSCTDSHRWCGENTRIGGGAGVNRKGRESGRTYDTVFLP